MLALFVSLLVHNNGLSIRLYRSYLFSALTEKVCRQQTERKLCRRVHASPKRQKNDSWTDLKQKLLALKSDLLSCQNCDL